MKAKLIRNKLAAIPKAGVVVRSLPPGCAAHIMALTAKMGEEVAEIADAPWDVSEYADLFEVALQVAHFNGIPAETIYGKMLEKRAERGGFGEGYYMETTDEAPL